MIIPPVIGTFPASSENFPGSVSEMYQILIRLLIILLSIFRSIFKSRSDLLLENVALRQQLSTYKIKKSVPKLNDPNGQRESLGCSENILRTVDVGLYIDIGSNGFPLFKEIPNK